MPTTRTQLIPTQPPRQATLEADETQVPYPQVPTDMLHAPVTVEVDASGTMLTRIEHDDPADSMPGGQQIRLDVEVSLDAGESWHLDGYWVWAGGKNTGGKQPGVHYLEFTPAPLERFPNGWRYRLHHRQLRAGRYGLLLVQET